MDQNEVLELNLLSDGEFGLVNFELTNKWIEEEKIREEDCKNLEFRLKRTKQLKSIARTGLSNSARRRYWFILSGGYELYTRVGNVYELALENAKVEPINEAASFGVSFKYLDFLPPQISPILPTFLHALWFHNQNIEYSPMIPAIATMLLMYMEPPLAYLSIQAIINKSRESLFYVLLNKKQLFAAIDSVEKLIVSRLPNVADHATKLGINLSQLILSIFPSFFIPFVSYPVSLTFFDSFVSEGRKVFFRFILQILSDEKSNLIGTADENEFDRIIFNAIDRLNDPIIMKSFIKKAFKIKLKRKNIFKKLEKRTSELPHPEKIQLNFGPLHEMLPPTSFKSRYGHRRTRTLDSKARKSIEILKLSSFKDFSMAMANNSPEMHRAESVESISSNETNQNIDSIIAENQNRPNIDSITSENKNRPNIDSITSDILSTGSKNSSNVDSITSDILSTESVESTESNNSKISPIIDSKTSSGEIELQSKIAVLSNDSSEFVPAIKPSNANKLIEKTKIRRVSKSKDEEDLDNVKDIQSKIARSWLPSVYSHGEQNLIFTEQMLLFLRNQLPPVFRLYSADLVFKMSVHGSNFRSLFTRCTSQWQYIMIIKTEGGIVGAFLSDPPLPKQFGRYFGSGMTFVFNMSETKFFKLKKPLNDYFISVSEENIMIGGPNPALYFENGFRYLRSNQCDTFNSPRLTKNVNGDEIYDFEMYRFIPHHYMRQRRKSIGSIQKGT